VTVAGNVKTGTGLASIEYGVEHLGTPLLLVLGHTCCGAVTAAIKHARVQGHIPRLLDLIEPARAMAEAEKPGCSEAEIIPRAIVCNVWLTCERVLEDSDIVRAKVREGKLKIEAAVYDIDDGRVTFMGPHPKEAELLEKMQAPGAS
jgi:carbonic anhydrase